MLVKIESPETPIVFHMDIEDIEEQGYNVYCSAHAIWGEQGWNTLQVTHNEQVLVNMINSSTMVPTIVEDLDI